MAAGMEIDFSELKRDKMTKITRTGFLAPIRDCHFISCQFPVVRDPVPVQA